MAGSKAAGARPKFTPIPFQPADDGFAAEHAATAAWIDAAVASHPKGSWYQEVDLKSLPAGQTIFDAKPDAARRLVVAALARVRHLDDEANRVRAQGKTETDRANAHHLPGWEGVWKQRHHAAAVLQALLKRSLPLTENDLLALCAWCTVEERMSTYQYPVGSIVRSIERWLKSNPMTDALRDALRKMAARMRESYDKDVKRLATTVEQLYADASTTASTAVGSTAKRPTPDPAPAGDPLILWQLKRALGVSGETRDGGAPEDEARPPEIGADHFPLRADSPLAAEHAMLSELIDEVVGTRDYYTPDLKKTAAGKRFLQLDPAALGRLTLAAAERAIASVILADDGIANWQARHAAQGSTVALAATAPAFDRADMFDMMLFIAGRQSHDRGSPFGAVLSALVAQAEQAAVESPLSEGERYVLHLLRTSLVGGAPFGSPPELVARLTTLVGDEAVFMLVPGEVWSDALNNDLGELSLDDRAKWAALLRHLLTATAARPSAKWLKTADELVAKIGPAAVVAAMTRWFPLVTRGKSVHRVRGHHYDTRGAADVMYEDNANSLRGMLWIVPKLAGAKGGADLVRAVPGVALSAYRKVPGVGPRAVKVGNAAIYTLSELKSEEAVGQLAMLKVRVKFGTAQKEIEKAFNKAAEALGLPRDQIEEMGVPSYGLEDVGSRREVFGEFAGDLRVDGRDVEIAWSRVADGKAQKSVPAKVKSDFKDEFKEFQQSAKDIAAMLPAQSERLDSMFLTGRRWPADVWRARYLDHPLVGTLARRLIWTLRSGASKDPVDAIWLDGKLVDAKDKPAETPDGTEVELWHPIGHPTAEALAWRDWLRRHEVRQPFKQAHREVYLLTDAERTTNTYSNRFAAHIIRQHQFNALCAARGWRNKLRLMVDDTYPPATKELPTFGLRAEYWIEGIGENYGTDTTDSGAYLRLVTDQVRFYRTGAATAHAHAGGGGYTMQAAGPGQNDVNLPLPLETIPPLALSEVMRDVDLFVGVASVGNDPTWQDGGPEGRFQTYWQSYSFGELSATAQTRREVLEQLVPRLKIRDRATLADRFLVVRGNLRTYKIHLGSGNILMEPNDQYLCIVAARGGAANEGGEALFLPFEGDGTLSVILSKAFLLAADDKITDSTITRQIKAS